MLHKYRSSFLCILPKGRTGGGLGCEPCRLFFGYETRSLEFDLEVLAVRLEVSLFCEGDGIFAPCLSCFLCEQSLEGLAIVVLCGFFLSLEVGGGAENLAGRRERDFHVLCGLEAEAEALAAAGFIELEQQREALACALCVVDDAVILKAEDVVVGCAEAVVGCKQVLKNFLSHGSIPFLYLTYLL